MTTESTEYQRLCHELTIDTRLTANRSDVILARWFERVIDGSWRLATRNGDRHANPPPTIDEVTQGALDEYVIGAARLQAPATKPFFDRVFRVDQHLPLVDVVRAESPGTDLSNTVLVGVQHLLGTTIPLLAGLRSWGLRYENMFMSGKVYSTHPMVTWHLESLGAHVHAGSRRLAPDLLASSGFEYDEHLSSSLTHLLRQAIATARRMPDEPRSPRRLLIVDDGATAINAYRREHRSGDVRVCAVEQTRRGARLLHEGSGSFSEFPIVNVAESRPKLELESPLIGRSVVDSLLCRLRRLEGSDAVVEGRRVLVVGYGSVGRAVATALRGRGAIVQAFDTDPVGRRQARHDLVWEGDLPDHAPEIVIGCTGLPLLEELPGLPWRSASYLASASSSNTEFRGLLDHHDGGSMLPAADLPSSSTDPVHADWRVGTGTDGPLLLNGGFPLNFPGTYDPIDAGEIQLTRALLLAGARQAIDLSESNTSGLVDFDGEEGAELGRLFGRR